MSLVASMRRDAMARWARIRSRCPGRLQDALTHLPVRGTADTPDLCRTRGWRCDMLPPATRPAVPAPRLADAVLTESFRRHGPAPPGPRFVAHLPGGRVLGSACTAVAAGGVVLADVSPHLGMPPDRHRALTSFLWAPAPRRFPGVAALIGTVGRHNHFHWLVESLPRIDGLLGLDGIDRIDSLIVTRRRLPWIVEGLGRLGVSTDRIVSLGSLGHVEADLLLAPSTGCAIGEPSREAVEFLRRSFGVEGPSKGRRLLIHRRGSRTLSNGAEIEAALSRLEFETIDPARLGILEQARIFGEASVVVGVHGAGLANIAFMPPGGTVLEIVPSRFMSACYAVLAAAAGHLHAALPADPAGNRAGRHAPLRMDTQRLIEGMESLGIGRNTP